jgi:hypothetical protein
MQLHVSTPAMGTITLSRPEADAISYRRADHACRPGT